MSVANKSLQNLVKQKPGWKHQPTIARRFPMDFVEKLEAIAHKLDNEEPINPEFNCNSVDSLSTSEIQKLRMRLSLITEKRSLYFSEKFNSLVKFVYSKVNEAEKVYLNWIKKQIENSIQLTKEHAKNTCLIINNYKPFETLEEINKLIKDYPEYVKPIERKILENGQYIERTPESYFIVRGNKIRCYSPYDESGKTQLRFKKLPNHNFSSRKYGGDNSWFFPLDCSKFIIKDFEDFFIDNSVIGFKYYYQYKFLESKKRKIIKQEKEAKSFENFVENLNLEGYNLFEHQKSGIRWLIEKWSSDYKGAILADQMGLGKTWTAAIAASKICNRENIKNIFVICPASLIGNWQNELNRLGIKATVFSNSFQKIPSPLTEKSYFLIVDEAHTLQNDNSKRFQAVEKLTLGNGFKGIFMLTGTPMKNGKPINLYPLLKLLNHPIAFKKGNYEIRYCDAHLSFNRTNNLGAINLKELSEKTSDCILQRKKKDCLNLPEKIRSIIEIKWTKNEKIKYFEKYRDMWESYLKKITDGKIKPGAEALIKVNILRQCSSNFKVDWCIKTIESLVSEGQKIVVFSEFLSTIKEILLRLRKANISCRELLGSTPLIKRTQNIQDFQKGKYDVFVGSTKSGGLGITLTNANNLILLDRPWTPGDTEQAEDRVYRIGQTKSANIYWPQLGDVDKIIDLSLNSKSANIELVLEGKNTVFQSNNLLQLQQQIFQYYQRNHDI